MLVAQRAQALQEFWRCHVETAFALHRFDDDGSDAAGYNIVLENRLDRSDGFIDADTVQRIGKLGVEDLWRKGAKTGFVGCHFAGQPQGKQRAAVVTAGKSNDGSAFGVSAGNLDRVLNRLGTRGQEQGFLWKVARGQGVDALSQFDIRLVGQHLKTGVGVKVELGFDGGNHRRVAMPGVEHRNATGKVDVAFAFDIPYLGVFTAGDEDFVALANAARDGSAPPGHQVGICQVGSVLHINPVLVVGFPK